ncbi:MAG: hypothetical protein KC505_01050 [Myxococcales bacterium]|nr:hypothetical protein [Myxococcales bacterium]USN49907.1 MAG: hypothetical protein H6731_06400 [Myxococcales bacterium]
MKKKFFITTLGLLLGFLLIYAYKNSSPNKKESIVLAGQTWAGSIVIEEIMKQSVENHLKIPVEIKQVSSGALWPALEKGSAHVLADLWMPNQKQRFDKYVNKRKTVSASISYDHAPQGFYLPTAIAKEFSIKSIQDIKGKEYLFDSDGDGKGEIWIGPFSWTASEINTSKIKQYGLDLEAITIEQPFFLTTLKKAMKLKKPILFYYWEPEWPTAKYDLTRIEEPPCKEGHWLYVPDHPEKNRVDCAYPDATVYVGVSNKLKEIYPQAFNFFMNFSIPIEDVSSLIIQLEDLPGNPPKTPQEVARAWIENNPQHIQKWLSKAKA